MSLAVAIAPEVNGPQATRRAKAPKSPKAPSRQVEARPKKVSFYLSDSALKRLGIHATMEGKSQSSLVEELIQGNLRRFEMPRAARSSSPVADTGEDRQPDPAA